ncbi:MAG: isochorismatase family protein [Burkholderiaceae bacterium]
MHRIWDPYLTELDRQVHAAAGYGRRGGFGTRPALFIIDMQYNFCCESPMPILEAVKLYRTACGDRAWKAVPHIVRLMNIARQRGIPIFYTITERRPDLLDGGVNVAKSHRGHETGSVAGQRATETIDELKPRPQDFFVNKAKPSAFFGTPFMSQLNFLDIDTLIVTGCSTSGCVRATSVEAFSLNFKVVVAEEATFDRFESSHAMNLFDLNCKYADVIATDEVAAYLQQVAPNAVLSARQG